MCAGEEVAGSFFSSEVHAEKSQTQIRTRGSDSTGFLTFILRPGWRLDERVTRRREAVRHNHGKYRKKFRTCYLLQKKDPAAPRTSSLLLAQRKERAFRRKPAGFAAFSCFTDFSSLFFNSKSNLSWRDRRAPKWLHEAQNNFT